MPQGKKQKSNRNPRRKGEGLKRKRRVPSHILWGLLVIVAVVYIVFFYKAFIGPYSFRWKALYGNSVYPNAQVRGIDISHYQENIDWDRVRNATIQDSPVRFVFIKATEGTDKFDPNFNINFFNARKSGLIRGAYHFFSTKSNAKDQALFFCRMVQLEEGDLPPVLDVETEVDRIGSYSKEKLKREVSLWLDIVEKYYQVTPILYASYSFRQHYLDDPTFDRYPFWIAHYYVDSLSYTGQWAFWQHTDAGHIDGIKGYVDINIFNGDMDDLEDLLIDR